jgi:hypothetical protein
MEPGLDLELLACRLTFRARRPLLFPPPASNRFRGAMGFELPESIFRPRSSDGPSGLIDRPRPFALRAEHLDGRQVLQGDTFHLGLNLFLPDPVPFHDALSVLEWAEMLTFVPMPVSLQLAQAALAPTRVRVRFVTMTELKPPVARGTLPSFEILISRLRDRISALRSFYGPGPLDLDFAAFAERASSVRTTGGALVWHETERHSLRTGQVHPLNGFTGYVDYEGDIAEFIPWLRAGEYTGVGRQTVWGKGVLLTELF